MSSSLGSVASQRIVEPGLLRRPVAAAHVGNVEPGDLRREVGRPDS